jgi:uncharacterized protein (DUF2336 family)
MDLTTLEKSAHVAPLLVRLYDSQRVYLQGGARRHIAHEDLTATASELIASPLNSREQELVTDVLLALLRQAEIDLRQALADRMAAMDNAPVRLILKLAHDDILVARSVLTNSPVLNDLDLLYIIKAKDSHHWQAIAKRQTMGSVVVDALAEQRDEKTVETLAVNKTVKLTDYAFRVMGEMAQYNTDLAQPLLSRPDVPEPIARMLYKAVGNELQSYIDQKFKHAPKEVQAVVSEVVREIATPRQQASYLPTAGMMQAAMNLEGRGDLTATLMIKTLKRGQIASFVAMFSTRFRLPANTVIQMIMQPTGQSLAVACRAVGLPKAEFMQFYLLTQRARTGDGFIDQTLFNRSLTYFDQINPSSAAAILEASQTGNA